MNHARPRPIAAAGIAIIAVVGLAACSSGAAPAWTYAPPLASPSAAPSGSAGASGSPAAGGSPATSASPAASSSPGGGASGSPDTGSAAITIKAQNIAFDQSSVSAAAGKAFTIAFDNEDAGIPHNLDVKDSSGASVAKTDIANGPSTVNLQVPALQAGTYTFVCDVHPNMTGSLEVK